MGATKKSSVYGCVAGCLAVFCMLLPGELLAGDSDKESSVALFDGKTLDGWVQRGGKAVYKVEEGCIVGTTLSGTPNSFLCTKKDYADFVLDLEFKVDPGLNSGIQIRSNAYDKERMVTIVTSDGKQKTKKVAAGRVHGYQVEIDPSARSWSGGIYDEGRRGWLNNLKDNEKARKAFKQDEWNHYRIEAVGDHIRTWVNGVPAADLKDGMTAKGFIGLQVHSSRKSGQIVRWRNITVREVTR